MYARQEMDSSLWKLWKQYGNLSCFPASALRAIAFEQRAWKDYFCIIFVNIKNRFTWSGFLAAMLVTAVWLSYLLQLHVFSKGSRRYLGFSFCLGNVDESGYLHPQRLPALYNGDGAQRRLAIRTDIPYCCYWLYRGVRKNPSLVADFQASGRCKRAF
ncbi:MAG: hypothetical protein R3B47_12740 [Bacteroidia bacterium]